MPKITKRIVDGLHPKKEGKDSFIWDAGDGALKGFGVRVKPSGSATYLVQYRNREGRTRRLALAKSGPSPLRRHAGWGVHGFPKPRTVMTLQQSEGRCDRP